MKKISLLILGLVLFAMCSCSTGDEVTTKKEDFKTVCLDGVTYYLFSEYIYQTGYGYMSVKLDRNSKIIPCVD